METKTKGLLTEVLKLTKSERDLLVSEIKKFDSQTFLEQRNMSESLSKSLGPLSGNRCPVCGK